MAFDLRSRWRDPSISLSGRLLTTRNFSLAPLQTGTLQRLTAENLDISAADIAKWQTA